MKKFFNILFYIVVSLLIANIDVIFGLDYSLIGDRVNYINHVRDPLKNSYDSLFSFFNYEYLWFQFLNIIKFLTFSNKENFVLRVVTFISSLIFLNAFKKRTNSALLPLFIILMPGVFDFYVVKLRHGFALAIFAYLSNLRLLKFRNLYYLPVTMIHSSFLLTIPIYIFGLRLKKFNLLKLKKFFLNIAFFLSGGLFSFFALQLMKFFGIRQYSYISEAVINADFNSFGIYRLAILFIILSLTVIKVTSNDSDSIIYSTSFFLGFSLLSFIGGRFLSTYLPFLVSELLLSKTNKYKIIYWFIRFLVISIFIYGWIINLSQPGLGFYSNL